MCTIIVRHQLDDGCSTVVAANRDEFYDREATRPLVLWAEPRVVGGRDQTKGGTWFGLTDSGLFVGLTNQRNFALPDDSLRSRGELVVEALRTGSHAGVRDYLRSIDPREFNEFNIVFGDGTSLELAYGRSANASVELEPLGAGVHVLCNDRVGSAAFPKARVAQERVGSIAPQSWETLKPQLVAVLADETLPDASLVPPVPNNAFFDQALARQLQAICVKTPVYGTVSATLAAVEPGRALEYHFSPTPPNRGDFEDYTGLLRP